MQTSTGHTRIKYMHKSQMSRVSDQSNDEEYHASKKLECHHYQCPRVENSYQ